MKKEEQSKHDLAESRAQVTIHPCDNGFIVRIFPARLVFATLPEVFEAIEKHFTKK